MTEPKRKPCGPCGRRRRRNPGQGDEISMPFGGEVPPSLPEDRDTVAVILSDVQEPSILD